MTTCQSPFKIKSEPDVDYCLPACPQGFYWYKDNSCRSVCNPPYVPVPYSGVLQCLFTCPVETDFYYDAEGVCKATCVTPYQTYQEDGFKGCRTNINIDLDTVGKLKDASESIKNQGEFASGGMKAAGALNSGNPGSALLAGLSSMLQYIRYMKINYPPKVETMFLVAADEPISISFDFDIPPAIKKKLADHPLPNNFDKYDINSNFVNNMWDLMGSLLLSVVAIFVLMFVTFFVKKYHKVHIVFKKFLGVAKWNIPAMMLCSSSGDIFFFAALHVNVMRIDSFAAVVCFLITIAMVGATVGLWILTVMIVWNYRKIKPGISLEDAGFKDKWKDYELLYASAEEKSILTMSYMTLFIARGFIFNLTIACLYEYPLVQVIIINSSNFLMFGYLVVYRPLKDFINLVQVFINEVLVIILSVSTLILAVMDKAEMKGTPTRVIVGEAILFVIKTFNMIGLAFLAIQMIMMLVYMFKSIRYFRAKGIKSPLKMLQVIVFEEFEYDKAAVFKSMELAKSKKQKILKPPRKNLLIATDTSVLNKLNHDDSSIFKKTLPQNDDNDDEIPVNRKLYVTDIVHEEDGEIQFGSCPPKELHYAGIKAQNLDESEIITINDFSSIPETRPRTTQTSQKNLRRWKPRAPLMHVPAIQIHKSEEIKDEETEELSLKMGENASEFLKSLKKMKERREKLKLKNEDEKTHNWYKKIKTLKDYLKKN